MFKSSSLSSLSVSAFLVLFFYPCCCSDGAQATIDELHGKGKFVSCYISVGTVESWRSDAGAFPSEALGNSWDDWEGERFLDVSQQVP